MPGKGELPVIEPELSCSQNVGAGPLVCQLIEQRILVGQASNSVLTSSVWDRKTWVPPKELGFHHDRYPRGINFAASGLIWIESCRDSGKFGLYFGEFFFLLP